MPSAFFRAFCLCLCSTGLFTVSVYGADQKPVAFPLPEVQEISDHLATSIELLGQGQIEKAVDVLELELPKPLKRDEGPFSTDQRGAWLREVAVFAATQPHFESIDLVGAKHLSTQAKQLVYIGNGHNGPILIQFNVFRYQNDWKLVGFAFHGNWAKILEASDYEPFDKPHTYPCKLKTTILRSANKQSDAKVTPAGVNVPAPLEVDDVKPLRRLPTVNERDE